MCNLLKAIDIKHFYNTDVAFTFGFMPSICAWVHVSAYVHPFLYLSEMTVGKSQLLIMMI